MNHKGMTLIELLSALSIAAILGLVAIPGLMTLVEKQRLRSSASTLFHTLSSARSTAVFRNIPITVWNQDGNWADGVEFFSDLNADAEKDTNEAVLYRQNEANAVEISGNRWVATSITFHPDGSAQTASGAFQVGTITVCGAELELGYKLILSIGGRIRLIKHASACKTP
ncbi:prepilin-type N-terminal cleavage/methylation domain-containing protein [Spongiibacter sp. IMCC21906]|uniref:GspH/FimT family pseudopilin n=1 Tax=Spongiibacter sp. IMCC21906 TaxID=1620392 RepID=UPI00062DD89F|nr:GspH/FimT family pseudopilin [Spongiibacter sp. IMCC21906]AKH68969.1 prepilin-type N-terminal cleavage/methylation domain-containing protein [Spongiibacter sp. IMCC21906]